MNTHDSAVALLVYSIQTVVSVGVPWLVVRTDTDRLPAELQGRCWPESTFWVSTVGFGPLCLPVHFVRTRGAPDYTNWHTHR